MAKELTRAPRRAAAVDRPSITPVSWRAPEDLDERSWLEQGRRIAKTHKAASWWIGDWINYGTARYGEKYAHAARVTGYDKQTLMNMAYVASRFEISRRRETLSWSHHAEVAALPPKDQARWLDLAELERMSVHCLRVELRSSHRNSAVREEPASRLKAVAHHEALSTDAIKCPNCGHRISVD